MHVQKKREKGIRNVKYNDIPSHKISSGKSHLDIDISITDYKGMFQGAVTFRPSLYKHLIMRKNKNLA